MGRNIAKALTISRYIIWKRIGTLQWYLITRS
jgi:biotin operon repressor